MTQEERREIENRPCKVAVRGRYVCQNGKIISEELEYVTVPAIVLTRALCDLFGVDLEGGSNGKERKT